jgi:hypothetical protein
VLNAQDLGLPALGPCQKELVPARGLGSVSGPGQKTRADERPAALLLRSGERRPEVEEVVGVRRRFLRGTTQEHAPRVRGQAFAESEPPCFFSVLLYDQPDG